MQKIHKITFGTLLAISSMIPTIDAAEPIDFLNKVAVWVEGTYTKPSNNGLSVGDLLFVSSPIAFGIGPLDGGRRHTFLDPHHDFDYALGISYRWLCHSRLFITYDHYKNNDELGEINIRNIGLEPGVGIGIGSTQGIASYDIKSDEFRIGARHDLYFGDHFGLDLLAFFEYDKVRQTLSELNNKAEFVFARETEERVSGWGPGVGFMARWYVGNPHWHIFAGANTTLLAVDNEYEQAFLGGGLTEAGFLPAFYIYDPEESNSLIGKLDVNFGINYHCALKQDFCGMIWGISLGMRYMNMFNVFKNGNTAYNPDAVLFSGANLIGPASFAANLGYAQDWGRWGPFLKLKVGGSQS